VGRRLVAGEREGEEAELESNLGGPRWGLGRLVTPPA
jgi:hypothetical protein